MAKNEIAKSMRNKAHYQLVYIVKQRHKSPVNTWKSPVNTWKSPSFMVLRELQWFVGSSWISVDLSLFVSIFFFADDTFPLAFLVMISAALLLGTSLRFSPYLSICCSENYSPCLLRMAKKVIMFAMQATLNSLQAFSRVGFFFGTVVIFEIN